MVASWLRANGPREPAVTKSLRQKAHLVLPRIPFSRHRARFLRHLAVNIQRRPVTPERDVVLVDDDWLNERAAGAGLCFWLIEVDGRHE